MTLAIVETRAVTGGGVPTPTGTPPRRVIRSAGRSAVGGFPRPPPASPAPLRARALVSPGPDDIWVRFAKHTAAGLVAELAALRPCPGAGVGYATAIALRELGRRVQFPGGQLERPGELIVPLVTGRAPGLLTLYGVGPDIAAMLLVAAGDHPGRLRSEAAWAHLCATAPIPASSGKVTRHRLNPGGDRQAI